MESDEVSDTVNYAELFEMVKAEMSIPSNLLEHVAGRIAKAVFNAYRDVTAIDLTIVKDNPPMGAHCRGAGVELHLINDKTK
jgi:dihydroneopterin aldolase